MKLCINIWEIRQKLFYRVSDAVEDEYKTEVSSLNTNKN